MSGEVCLHVKSQASWFLISRTVQSEHIDFLLASSHHLHIKCCGWTVGRRHFAQRFEDIDVLEPYILFYAS